MYGRKLKRMLACITVMALIIACLPMPAMAGEIGGTGDDPSAGTVVSAPVSEDGDKTDDSTPPENAAVTTSAHCRAT